MKAESTEWVIEAEDASIAGAAWGGRTWSLHGVTWRVRAGETWLVTGGMGGGKTALLEAVAGLRPVTSGTLRVLGHEWAGLGVVELGRVRRSLGMVFEGRGRLFAGMTLLENVALPLCYHRNLDVRAAAGEAMAWLEEVGLARMSGDEATQVAPAWARRAALARALVLGPEVLLLDDPLGGLDPNQVRWWRNFLGQLRAGHPRLGGRPMTLVMATGSPRGWARWADRCAVVDGGTLHDAGPPEAWAGIQEPWLRETMTDG